MAKRARNRIIVQMREQFPDLTQAEIGRSFGLTPQRISAILKAAKRNGHK